MLDFLCELQANMLGLALNVQQDETTPLLELIELWLIKSRTVFMWK
jgi:hypothetical protein